uniref:Adaptor related protein complex 3 subunit sigma 2 n=1 Tax=Coturnix japonica TaxID=93934 RepID=A0A8C2YHN1_COTJA
MISAVPVFNNHGNTRLVRCYRHLDRETQRRILRDTFHLMLYRHYCSCYRHYTLIYQHYAHVPALRASCTALGFLYRLPCGTLGPHAALSLQMHYILQELVIGGMVLETSMNEIVAQMEAQSKLEKAEVRGGLSAAPSCTVSAMKNINLPEIPRNINIGDIGIKVPNLSQFM